MTTGILAVVAFGLLLIVRKSSKVHWSIKSALALIGGSALAETWLGNRLADGMFAAAGWGPWPAVTVVGVVTFLWAVAVVVDIAVDRRADNLAIMGLILLPILFTIASGPVAEGGSQLTASVRQLGEDTLGPAVGS